jgi:hypothetical protein
MSTNKRSIDPAIIAAIIGVLGTLCVTIITLSASRLLPTPQPSQPAPATQPPPVETWTPTATLANTETPAPTDTVPAGNPTSTAAPETSTLQPSLTPAPPAIGSDWANGCISILWKPYPPSIQPVQQEDCFVEPVNVFFALDRRLTFAVPNTRFENPEVYGLFGPLPSNGTASLQTLLRTLQDGEIWIGVFAQPDINSQGSVIVIPPGNVTEKQLIQLAMPEQAEIRRTDPFVRNPPVYDFLFEFGNGTVKTTVMGGTALDERPVASDQLWLFVGYKVQKGNNRIDAEFLNLFVQGQ